ncbi:unnamed protein product [Taenia asiatica]|uniref:Uncharacterized protein n=1 Tax=Taenia asiatica TaxID=60517 RepID=A0A0R3W784_TAEAS|nr:unnamed protein product [Taenia asiatica]
MVSKGGLTTTVYLTIGHCLYSRSRRNTTTSIPLLAPSDGFVSFVLSVPIS